MQHGNSTQGMTIGLLGGFTLTVDGRPADGIGGGAQRLLAFLALHDRAMARTSIAGILRPDVTTDRANDSLRSMLSRLDDVSRAAVTIDANGLALESHIAVDHVAARALAHRLLDPASADVPADLAAAAIATLSRALLPDWYDDWIGSHCEDWRQLRAAALEALALRLLRADRFGEAEEAARAAMRVDPLRETPHAALIRIHLAHGNQSEALLAFTGYRTGLREALDIEPSAHLRELIATIGNESARR
jgi:DNA-binding SARP family transcriptional activator